MPALSSFVAYKTIQTDTNPDGDKLDKIPFIFGFAEGLNEATEWEWEDMRCGKAAAEKGTASDSLNKFARTWRVSQLRPVRPGVSPKPTVSLFVATPAAVHALKLKQGLYNTIDLHGKRVGVRLCNTQGVSCPPPAPRPECVSTNGWLTD